MKVKKKHEIWGNKHRAESPVILDVEIISMSQKVTDNNRRRRAEESSVRKKRGEKSSDDKATKEVWRSP